MTNVIRVVAGSIMLAVCSHCFAFQEHAVGANDDLRLDPNRIHELELASLSGNADAASRLATYYGFYKNDQANELKWLTIAAENGDPIAQCNLAKVMGASRDDASRRRAAFWLARCQERQN